MLAYQLQGSISGPSGLFSELNETFLAFKPGLNSSDLDFFHI